MTFTNLPVLFYINNPYARIKIENFDLGIQFFNIE